MIAETQVKERPILFRGEMVRAILSGAKTQTRRIVEPQPKLQNGEWYRKNSRHYREVTTYKDDGQVESQVTTNIAPPELIAGHYPHRYGRAGERLWVRETWLQWTEGDCPECCMYRADQDPRAENFTPWKPSIHMPRWASRLSLEVTHTRVERLQDITSTDAEDEGLLTRCGDVHPAINEYSCGDGFWTTKPIVAFHRLWDSINGKTEYSWQSNPWVWVVEFKRIDV